MKLSHLLTGMAFLIGMTASANAATVDLGEILSPSSGSVIQLAKDSSSDISGWLPSNSTITFTFSYGASPAASLNAGYWYDGAAGTPNPYSTGSTFAYFYHDPNSGTDNTDGYSVDAELASAISNISATGGLLTITNLSSVKAHFSVLVWVMFNSITNNISYTYNVTSVPLPAALPLMASGLAGLAFLRRRRAA